MSRIGVIRALLVRGGHPRRCRVSHDEVGSVNALQFGPQLDNGFDGAEHPGHAEDRRGVTDVLSDQSHDCLRWILILNKYPFLRYGEIFELRKQRRTTSSQEFSNWPYRVTGRGRQLVFESCRI